MGETDWHYTQPKMCAKFVYDLNGKRDPNTKGKDIGFITIMYPTDSVVVAPMPLIKKSGNAIFKNAVTLYMQQDPESRLPNK